MYKKRIHNNLNFRYRKQTKNLKKNTRLFSVCDNRTAHVTRSSENVFISRTEQSFHVCGGVVYNYKTRGSIRLIFTNAFIMTFLCYTHDHDLIQLNLIRCCRLLMGFRPRTKRIFLLFVNLFIPFHRRYSSTYRFTRIIRHDC